MFKLLFVIALATTMLGWGAVIAPSLNYTMHYLNGKGPGKRRPSNTGKSECLVAVEKYNYEWLGVLSDDKVVKVDTYGIKRVEVI